MHPQLATGIQTPKKITGIHLGYTMVVTAWWEKLGCAPQVLMGPHGQEASLDGFYELPYNMPPGFASAVGRDFNRWTANQQTWGIPSGKLT